MSGVGNHRPGLGRRYLRIQEAAVVLGLSERTVRRHVKSGRFASVRVGNILLIPATEIDALALEAARSRK